MNNSPSSRVLLADDDPALAPLYGMLRYHLGWADAELRPVAAPRGKRLRRPASSGPLSPDSPSVPRVRKRSTSSASCWFLDD